RRGGGGAHRRCRTALRHRPHPAQRLGDGRTRGRAGPPGHRRVPGPPVTDGFAVTGPGAPAALLDASCPDVYFTAGYGRAAAETESGSWQTIHEYDRLMLPHVLRSVNDTDADAASPYGYSGLHVDAGCTPADLARFWSRAVAHW